MSEYATRKSDGKFIYIGSCDEMCCLRYEDRNKVIPECKSFDIGNCTGLHWRIPIADEDGVLPGEYDGSAYYRKDSKYNFFHINYHCLLDNDPGYFEGIVKQPGSFQLVKDALGLILSVKCYHGFKINGSNEEAGFGWNGKSDAVCLCGVKNEEQEMKILYTCVACNSKWSVPFPKIRHLIISEEMKLRLFRLCSDYWEERNPGEVYPHVMARQTKNGKVTIKLKRWANPFGDRYAVSIETMDGDGQTDYFKTPESAFDCYTRY